MQYLTGIVDPKDRFLDIETLKKFKVGVGEEKFYDEDDEVWKASGTLHIFPHVFLSPTIKIRKREVKTFKEFERQRQENHDGGLRSDQVEGDNLELVKVKIRAIGAKNKKPQRTMPVGCDQQALFGLNTV